MRKIRFVTNGSPLPRDWKMFLDDIDISGYVHAINIDLDMQSLPGIHVTLIGELELPDEIKGILTVNDTGGMTFPLYESE